MLKYFFYNVNDIPDGYTWKAYGFGYFIWMAILLTILVVVCKIYKQSDDIKKGKIRKGLALLIFIQEIIKDILHTLAGSITLGHLPFHLCGLSIFFILWHAYAPNKMNQEYLYSLCLPGALLALLFPDWTIYPILHFSSFNSFTMHTWLTLYVVMQLYAKDFRPNYKNLLYVFVFMILYSIPIYFLNKLWDTNFLFINTPSEGSPLVPLYNLFGNFYVVAAYILFIAAWGFMYLPWILTDKKRG